MRFWCRWFGRRRFECGRFECGRLLPAQTTVSRVGCFGREKMFPGAGRFEQGAFVARSVSGKNGCFGREAFRIRAFGCEKFVHGCGVERGPTFEQDAFRLQAKLRRKQLLRYQEVKRSGTRQSPQTQKTQWTAQMLSCFGANGDPSDQGDGRLFYGCFLISSRAYEWLASILMWRDIFK